jgi:hypothetical protein
MRRLAIPIFALTTLAGAALLSAPAFANSDDAAWIAKCVSDNSDQKQTAEVVAVYCSCMNDKMSSNETLSITAWEKSHPGEEKACSQQAGWK